MVIRRRVVVHGRVQGVGFRMEIAQAAERRELGGWVQNTADGTVEAVFEGGAEDVEALERYCEYGPRGANVMRIESSDEEPEGLSGFEIR